MRTTLPKTRFINMTLSSSISLYLQGCEDSELVRLSTCGAQEAKAK